MEPTTAECQNFATIDDVADWVGIPTKGDDQSPRGTLFATLGMSPTDHWRVVAGMPEADYMAVIGAWEHPQGSSPTPALQSQSGLLGRAARITGGAQLRVEEARAHQIALAQATAGASAPVPVQGPAPPNAGAASVTKVKLCNIIDQYNDGEVDQKTPQDMEAGYKKYISRLGAMPEAAEDVTLKQFSGLAALFQSQAAPYVDFATFGPYGLRIEKKSRFSGLKMGSDGNLHQVEMFGPPTFAKYKECWKPFRTGCIMLDQIDPSTLDHYLGHLEQYVMRYGAAIWPIVYQADVHARSENIERVRRTEEAASVLAAAVGSTHPYDDKRPWNHTFRALVQDVKFWRIEVEEHAIMLLSKLRNLPNLLDGDALVKQVTTTTSTGSVGPEINATLEGPHLKTRKDKRKGENNNHNNLKNKKGKEICYAFNNGSCPYDPNSQVCPKNDWRVHQCSNCLSPQHGVHECPEPQKKGGKGKGRGKGRGRK